MSKKNIVVLLPYANPHVLGWINELNLYSNLEINCLYSVQKYRSGYFQEQDYLQNVNYLFKDKKNKTKYFEQLKRAEVFISLGIFEKSFLQSLIKINKDCKVFVLSEPFNPISSSKKLLLRRLISNFCRSVKVDIIFLSIGGQDVKNYYTRLGFVKNEYYNFGYFPAKKDMNLPIQSKEKINLLFVGQLIERKGYFKQLQVLDYIENNKISDKWSFNIVGNGKFENDLIEKIKGYTNVNYLGLINDPNRIDDIYKDSDILFIPSQFDGWGAVVNEAISHGLIIISSNTVYSSKSLIKNHFNGFTFNYNDDVTLFKIIKDLLLGKIDIITFKNNSLSIYNEWNPNNAAKSFIKLLNEESNTNESLLKKI